MSSWQSVVLPWEQALQATVDQLDCMSIAESAGMQVNFARCERQLCGRVTCRRERLSCVTEWQSLSTVSHYGLIRRSAAQQV